MSLLKKLKKRMEEASNRAPDTKKLQKEAAKRAQKQAQKKQTTSDMTKKSVETQKKTLKESKGGQAYTGFVRSTVGVPLEFTGKVKVDDEVKKSTAYKVGSFAGDALSFAGGYGAVGKLLAKKTAKTAAKRAAAEVAKDLAEKEARKASGKMLTRDLLKKASKETAEEVTEKAAKANAKKTVSEKAAERLAETKYFRNKAEKALTKKGGKEVSEKLINREALKKADKFVEKARQDLVAEATAGVALNTAKAKSEGMDLGSKEYLEYIGKQGALNLAMGAGFEGLGAGVKAIKNLKNGKSIVQIIENGKPKYKIIDTPRNTSKDVVNAPWNVATNKREAMRDANFEFKERNGDMMRNKKANRESLELRNSNKKSNADLKNLEGTSSTDINQAVKEYKAGFAGERNKFKANATRIRQDGEISERVKKEALNRYSEGRDFDPVQKRLNGENSAPVKGTSNNTSINDIMNDDGFKEWRSDNDINITQEASESGKSVNDVAKERYKEYQNTVAEKVKQVESLDEKNLLIQSRNDEGFRKHIMNNNINMRDIAEKEGRSFSDVVKDEYSKYTANQTKTKSGARKRILGGGETEPTIKDVKDYITTQTAVKTPKIREMASEFVYQMKRFWYDEAQGLSDLAKKSGDNLINTHTNRVRQSINAAQQMVMGEKQRLVLNSGEVINGKSVKEIFRPIMEKGDDYYNEFQQYMYCRNEISYRANEGKSAFGGAELTENPHDIVRRLEKQHPEFKDYADEVYNYLDGLSRLEVDSGIISDDMYNAMKQYHKDYVPTHRADYILQQSGKNVKGRKVNISATKNLVENGSEKPFAPLHEQLAFETQRRMNACAMNDLGNRIYKNIGDGYFKHIDLVDGDAAKEMLTTTKDGDFVFNIKRGGKTVQLTVDKHLFDALSSLNSETFKVPGLYQANSALRTLTTQANPLFAVRNVDRDFFDAPSFSKNGTAAYVKNYGKAWKMIIANSPEYKMFKELGGTSGSFFDVAKQFDDGSWLKKNTIGKIEELNEAAENSARFAEFLATIEREGTGKDAILNALSNAQEVTLNFQRHGLVGKVINANGGTFFNAGIQDVGRIVKTFANAKSNPGALMKLIINASIFGIAPSVVNELVCGDMDGYKDMRTSDKDMNFLIPTSWVPGADTDEKFIKIPKGRVVSTIAMPVQRGVREAMGNTKPGEKWDTGMYKDMVEQTAPVNPAENNIFRPMMSAMDKNGRTWYGAPIVPDSMKNKKPSEQYDETTTRLAVALGKTFNISPKRIDYVMKQYSGVLGQVGQGMPLIGRPSISDAELTPSSATNILGNVLKSNFISDAATNNGYSNIIYDRAADLEMYKDDSIEDKMAFDYMNEAKSVMSDYSKQIKEIQANESLSTDEKNKKTREIRMEQMKVAKKYLSNSERAKDVSKEVSNKVHIEDFDSETKYKSALKEQLKVKLDGADAMLAEEDAKAKEDGKKLISKRLKKAGLSANEYYDLKAKGATLKQYEKAKENGVSLNEYIAAQKATKDSTSYADKTARLIDGGHVKNFQDAEAYDIKKSTWNAVVWAKNNGMSTKKIAKVIGNDSSTDTANRDSMKKYGTYGNGIVTPEALYKWIEKKHGDMSSAEKSLLWRYYAPGYDWFLARNPY